MAESVDTNPSAEASLPELGQLRVAVQDLDLRVSHLEDHAADTATARGELDSRSSDDVANVGQRISALETALRPSLTGAYSLANIGAILKRIDDAESRLDAAEKTLETTVAKLRADLDNLTAQFNDLNDRAFKRRE